MKDLTQLSDAELLAYYNEMEHYCVFFASSHAIP